MQFAARLRRTQLGHIQLPAGTDAFHSFGSASILLSYTLAALHERCQPWPCLTRIGLRAFRPEGCVADDAFRDLGKPYRVYGWRRHFDTPTNGRRRRLRRAVMLQIFSQDAPLSAILGLEEPRQADHPDDVVHTKVRLVNPCTGQVHVLDFTRQREVVAHKPVHTHARLQVKLECAAKVWMANPGGRDPGSAINKRNPPGPGREVVA